MELQNTQTDWSGVGGVEWSWWSGVAVLGVECSQTGPNIIHTLRSNIIILGNKIKS